MAGQSTGTGSSGAPLPPKILLAKPGLVSSGPVAVSKFSRGVATDEDAAILRSRIPSVNLLSDSWELHTDRLLPVIKEISYSPHSPSIIAFCFWLTSNFFVE